MRPFEFRGKQSSMTTPRDDIVSVSIIKGKSEKSNISTIGLCA